MSQVPFTDRLPAWTAAGALGVVLVVALFVAALAARRARTDDASVSLGSYEALGSALLGLLLAFNFSAAQGRFDDRQAILVREANAIGTAHLRCSVLSERHQRTCREHLRRYATLRITAYDAMARSEARVVAAAVSESDQLQSELWTLVVRDVQESPTVAHALMMTAMNDVIDLDAERRASLRIFVPQAVTLAIGIVCLAWALLVGYSTAGRRGVRRHFVMRGLAVAGPLATPHSSLPKK